MSEALEELFQDEHRAILTSVGELSAIDWKRYLLCNWEEYTRGHQVVKFIIFCGLHGANDGRNAGDARNVEDCKQQAVSQKYMHYFVKFVISVYIFFTVGNQGAERRL